MLIASLMMGIGQSLGQEPTAEATVIYPTFTPSHTPTATPTLVSTIESLGNTAVAYFSTSNDAPLTGQPFTITLTIELPRGARLTEAPQFSDPWDRFMLRSASELLSQTTADKTLYTQDLAVILWRPGYYRTPETFIGYSFGVVQETVRIPVRPAFIDVPTVLDSRDYNLRPFKPLVYLPYLSPLLVMAGFVVGGGLMRAALRWYKHRPSKTVEIAAPQPIEVFSDALNGLNTADPAEQVRFTSDHLRRYLQDRFEIPAPDLTTEELMDTLKNRSQLPDKLVNELRRLLAEADMIKFANTQPDVEFAQRLLEVALRWVTAADKLKERA